MNVNKGFIRAFQEKINHRESSYVLEKITVAISKVIGFPLNIFSNDFEVGIWLALSIVRLERALFNGSSIFKRESTFCKRKFK